MLTFLCLAPLALCQGECSISYITLKGGAVDCLLRRPYELSFKGVGNVEVLHNEPYDVLSGLARKFSYKYADDERMRWYNVSEGGESRGNLASESFFGEDVFAGDSSGDALLGSTSQRDLREILAGATPWHISSSFKAYEPSYSGTTLIFWRASSPDSVQVPFGEPGDTKLLGLLKYVSGGKFPYGFCFQYHEAALGSGACAPSIVGDVVMPRYVDVDVAVVTNRSSHPVTITRFLGSETSRGGLRLASNRNGSASKSHLNWSYGKQLGPYEALVIPLRLLFSYSDYKVVSPTQPREVIFPSNRANQRLFLRYLASHPRALQFDLSSSPDKPRYEIMKPTAFRKMLSRPWRDPKLDADFAYGPEYRLTGVQVASMPAPKVLRAANLFYTTSKGFGSCPFAEYWSPALGTWVHLGRVLVGRDCANKESEETRLLDCAPAAIKLQEREAESTHIVGIWLTIDGHRYLPIESASGVLDEGQERVYRFAVPAGLRSSPFTLHVRGYYERRPHVRLETD